MRTRMATGTTIQQEAKCFLVKLQGGLDFGLVHRCKRDCDDKGDETDYVLYR